MTEDFSLDARLSKRARLTIWMALEMGRGFGWALVITTVIVVGLLLLRAVGLHVLPADSQQAPPPMGAIVQPLVTAFV